MSIIFALSSQSMTMLRHRKSPWNTPALWIAMTPCEIWAPQRFFRDTEILGPSFSKMLFNRSTPVSSPQFRNFHRRRLRTLSRYAALDQLKPAHQVRPERIRFGMEIRGLSKHATGLRRLQWKWGRITFDAELFQSFLRSQCFEELYWLKPF